MTHPSPPPPGGRSSSPAAAAAAARKLLLLRRQHQHHPPVHDHRHFAAAARRGRWLLSPALTRCVLVPAALVAAFLTVHRTALLLVSRTKSVDDSFGTNDPGAPQQQQQRWQRTAACFSGEVRTFARTFPSIKQRFLDELPTPYDLHLVFNDEEDRARGLHVVETTRGGSGDEKDRRAVMGNVYDTIRRDPFADAATAEGGEGHKSYYGALGPLSDYVTYKGRTPSGSTAVGYIYQLAGLDACLHLRRSVEFEHGVRYTHAARLRYDTMFDGGGSGDSTLRSSLDAAAWMRSTDGGGNDEGEGESGLIVPKIQSHDGHNDKMAWGTIGAMEIYQSQLGELRERGLPSNGGDWCGGSVDGANNGGGIGGQRRRRSKLQPEACLEAYLRRKGVKVVPTEEASLRILRDDGSLSET